MQYIKGDTILKVENVSLALGGKTILRDVNVEIKDIVRPGGPVQGQVVGSYDCQSLLQGHLARSKDSQPRVL
jgi:ABC-type uncharacterized transport system YnjBCD ATPase subunit